jgi:hypothetical protein
MPARMLGSTNKGQLASKATSTQTSSTAKLSCGRHTAGC